ncbi:hypothetical protein FACS189485_03570 [Spirochaetia bacterium]|nr:hypothetical protein FACS189485_03570 [Spirochaetia bacterium]
MDELAHNNAKYIKWIGQLQEEVYDYRGSNRIYLYFLEMSFRIDKNQKTMQLLFWAKWDQIFSDITGESDNYDELLTKAESDYSIFYQYYLSSGHIITECAGILEQWKFMIYHFRDYVVQNELFEKSKKIKSNSPYWVAAFFHEIINEGAKNIESLFAKNGRI